MNHYDLNAYNNANDWVDNEIVVIMIRAIIMTLLILMNEWMNEIMIYNYCDVIVVVNDNWCLLKLIMFIIKVIIFNNNEVGIRG